MFVILQSNAVFHKNAYAVFLHIKISAFVQYVHVILIHKQLVILQWVLLKLKKI